MDVEIYIEPKMIAEIMELTGADTFKEAVEIALRHLIAVTNPTNIAGRLFALPSR